jgi:hypothetical protein
LKRSSAIRYRAVVDLYRPILEGFLGGGDHRDPFSLLFRRLWEACEPQGKTGTTRLTYHDRSATEKRGIVITPDMIEAGYDVMRGNDWENDTLEERRKLVASVFKAMYAVFPHAEGIR